MRPSLGRISLAIVAALAVLGVSPAVFTAVARRASTAEADAAPSPPPPIVTETVIYSFCSQPDCQDGETPNGVIEGSDGNFYGTTGPFGIESGGTIFELTPSGTLTTLHQFCPNMDPNLGHCLDGYAPGGVIEGSDGNFYGTAASGGANTDRGGGSTGTLYMVTPSGTFTTLYAFCARVDPSTENCLDGELPDGVIEGSDGNFYGTTIEGGLYAFGGARPAGTVFEMTPSGVLTTLYSFCSKQDVSTVTCLDGEEPAGLTEGSDGNFYGITQIGGQFGTDTGGGTVFKVTPSGTFATLYSFCSQKDVTTGNCLDGNGPTGAIEGSDGNFYGTTSSGGAHNDGTVFKLTPSGTLTTLYSFCSKGDANIHDCLDGVDPGAGLIEGSDGNFYGTTNAGGEFGVETNGGTAFMITPSGAFTSLYSFCSRENPNSITDCLDGAHPDAGVIEGSDRNLYGITAVGGVNGDFGAGTVFKLAISFPSTVAANLTISPGGHSFGTTEINNTRSATFQVRAHSRKGASIVLGSIGITGTDFSVDPSLTTCQEGQTLLPNQKCDIVVDFMPLKAGNGTGRLIVKSNAKEVHPKGGVVTLTGSGRPR